MKKLKKYKTLEFRFENTGTNIIYQKKLIFKMYTNSITYPYF